MVEHGGYFRGLSSARIRGVGPASSRAHPTANHRQPLYPAIQHHPSDDLEASGLWLLVFNIVYPCPWALAESPVIRNAISQPGSSFVRKNGVAGMKFSAPPHASPTAYQQTAALGGPKRELRGQILVDSWTIHKSKHVAYMVVTRSRGELGRSSVCVSNVRSPTAQC
jgi:hypothetical protein